MSTEHKEEKAKILEGILTGIVEVKTEFRDTMDWFRRLYEIDPHPHLFVAEITTTFTLKQNDGTVQNLQYKGVLLPDSLGNNVQVYAQQDKVLGEKTMVYDTKLNRWYK